MFPRSTSFVGDEHADAGVSMIFVEAGDGQGPSLHTHPYVAIHANGHFVTEWLSGA